MRRLKKTINKRGFTLSEMLVTIAIMSFVGIGAVGGIALVLRIHNNMEQKNNALMLMTVTEQDGIVLAGEDTGSKYHITLNGVPLSCTPDVAVEDGSYITVDNFVYTASSRVYEYDLVVNSNSDNEIMRQHIFIHVSSR